MPSRPWEYVVSPQTCPQTSDCAPLWATCRRVRRASSDPVRNAFRACHVRAVGAAVKRVVRLDAVPDHLDVAVLAGWGERVDRALETVEGVRIVPGHSYLEGLVVLISTDFALGHNSAPLPGRCD